MNLKEIKDIVQEIDKIKDDDEVAHYHEDLLQREFIKYVSTLDNYELAQKAKEVLKTRDIDFCRWYA